MLFSAINQPTKRASERKYYIAKYTIRDIASAISRSPRTVRRAVNDKKFNPEDINSLVDYIVVGRYSRKMAAGYE